MSAMARAVRAFGYCLITSLACGTLAGVHAQQRDVPATAGAAPSSGTSRVTGTVVTADVQHRPLRGAIVTLSGPALPAGRSSITDDQGNFTIARLPAGRYMLVVSKPAYLTTSYGATRPARPGVLLSIADGQQLAGISISMPHGAAISGMVTEANGQPASGSQVTVMRLARTGATLTAGADSVASSDDRGVFRVFGLAPGDYVVAAEPPGGRAGAVATLTASDVDATIAALRQQTNGSSSPNPTAASAETLPQRLYGAAPIFFPSTPSASDAQRITLAVGEERTDVDIRLSLVPIATLGGVITSVDGVVPKVQFIIHSAAAETLSMSSVYNRPIVSGPAADGTFKVANVVPGNCSIVVRTIASLGQRSGGPPSGSSPPSLQPVLYAATNVVVNGDDVTGLVMALQPAMRLVGKVVVDRATAGPALDLTKITLSVADASASAGNGPSIGVSAPLRADGSLEIAGLVPATYRVTAMMPNGSGIFLRSLVVAGKDVLDTGLDVRAGADLSALLTLSDRPSSLVGTLHVPTDQPTTGYFIVVYPVDRAMWRPQARRIQMVRPATDGRFSTKDLPPGEYYVAALTDVEPDDLADAAFFEALISASVKVTISEGEQKTQDLRIGG